MKYYLGIDIGASSGRHILGHVEDGKVVLEEIYRFYNGVSEVNGHLCWDLKQLFAEIKNGMKEPPEQVVGRVSQMARGQLLAAIRNMAAGPVLSKTPG